MTDGKITTREIMQELHELKERFQEYDVKLIEHLEASVEDRANLKHLCSQVNTLNKLITQGNGQESVLAKLAKLTTEMADVKEDTKALVSEVLYKGSKEESRAQVSKARWVAIGKVAGFLALVAPGLVAFFTML